MWEWSNKIFNKLTETKNSDTEPHCFSDPEDAHICYEETAHKAAKCNPSLVSAYLDILKHDSPQSCHAPEIVSISSAEMQSILENKIAEFGLKGIVLIEKPYDPQTWQEMTDYTKEYHRTRIAFLKLLSYSDKKGLEKLGLNKEDIALMKDGIAPENYNTHVKIPFDFGGNTDFSNISLIKSHPTHDYIHALIDAQIEKGFLSSHKKIFIPYFEGKIYYD